MTESELQQLIQIEARKKGILLLRNNSGALKDHEGRVVRFGLGNVSKEHNKKLKSLDLIGIEPVLITEKMVGQLVGVFTAIEVKAPGWTYKGVGREPGQKAFIDLVLKHGGKAGFAQSLDDLDLI